MQIATQLAIFLANQPGALARVCEALSEAGVNIHAVSTSDTVDHTVLRMVVSDSRKAIFLLEERGMLVLESDVILVDEPNRPGVLADIARRFAAANLNIDYLYCAASSEVSKGLLVIRVADAHRALEILRAQPPVAGGSQ